MKKVFFVIVVLMGIFYIVGLERVEAAIPEDNCSTVSNKLRFEIEGNPSTMKVGDNVIVKLVMDTLGCGGIEISNLRIRFDKSKLNLLQVSLNEGFVSIANQIDTENKGVRINNSEGYVDIFSMTDIINNKLPITVAGSDSALLLLRFGIVSGGDTNVFVDNTYSDLKFLGVDSVGGEADFGQFWQLKNTEVNGSKVKVSIPIGVCAYNLNFNQSADGLITVNDFVSFRTAFIEYMSGAAANAELVKRMDFNCVGGTTITDFTSFRIEFLKRF